MCACGPATAPLARCLLKHKHAHIFTHMQARTRTHARTAPTHTCIYTHARTRAHTCTHVRANTYTHARAYTYTHARARAHTHIHTYVRTRVHGTNALSPRAHPHSHHHASSRTHALPFLRAGIIIFSCLDCRCTLGFSLLTHAEGPTQVLETIVARFEHIPELIVYDNACNLASSAMKHFPALFSRTIFMVDKFHSAGHKCSPLFQAQHERVRSREVLIDRIPHLNTSLAEQRNRMLTTAFNSLTSAAPDTFLRLVALLVMR